MPIFRRHIGWSLSLAVLLAGCAVAPGDTASARSRGHLVWPVARVQHRYQVTWEPDARVIAEVERVLSLRVRRSGHALSDYFVRYYGTEVDGKRYVMCKGMHHTIGSGGEYLRLPVNDDSIELDAFGGGSYFFTASYDVRIRKVVAFGFNAPL
jgi:hypothetical protein